MKGSQRGGYYSKDVSIFGGRALQADRILSVKWKIRDTAFQWEKP